MTAKDYVFSEVNTKKKINNCHLAVIGQDFADVNYWILGDIFNYNFYASFDAERNPRVGLAKKIEASVEAEVVEIPGPIPQTKQGEVVP